MIEPRQNAQSAEIKRLNEKIRNLENVLALLPGHVYWMNRDFIYQGCNNLQARAVNLSTPQDIVGKTTQELVHDQAESLDQINKAVIESGKEKILEETTVYANKSRTFLSQKVPLRDEQGQITGLLGVSMDISDRKEMEKALKAAKEMAEISSKAKSEFIRNMEHDIRTPLSGIWSVAAHLAGIEEDPSKQELLEDMKQAAQQLISYFNTIIEVSRLSEEGTPVIIQEIDLEALVNSMFQLELPAAKYKQLDFSLSVADTVPKKILGDSFRLYRILLNLVSNAIKFTPKGKINIRVQLASEPTETPLLEFIVSDTGIGIKEEDREAIYEKFKCGTSDRGQRNTGMGLGLWIVKKFMEDLGGEIKLESEMAKGSVFTCRLPYQVA